jgi:hypothetical protein
MFVAWYVFWSSFDSSAFLLCLVAWWSLECLLDVLLDAYRDGIHVGGVECVLFGALDEFVESWEYGVIDLHCCSCALSHGCYNFLVGSRNAGLVRVACQ